MSRRRDTAAVIAPPPVLFLAAIGLGFLLDAVAGTSLLAALPALPRGLAAAALLAFAGVLGFAGIVSFRRAQTPVEPWHPTRALVTSGVYARVRNPMYLGLVVIAVAVALVAASDGVALTTVGLGLVLHHGVIKPEERYLVERFGSAYARYLARVPRWGVPISRRSAAD